MTSSKQKYFPETIINNMHTKDACLQARTLMDSFLKEIEPHGILVLNGMNTVCKYYYSRDYNILFLVDDSSEFISEEESLNSISKGEYLDMESNLSLTHNMEQIINRISEETQRLIQRPLYTVHILYMDRIGAIDEVRLNKDDTFERIAPFSRGLYERVFNMLNTLSFQENE